MKMPDAKTYDDEMKYMPWGRMLDQIVEELANTLPEKASVLDLMCGTGYLLRNLRQSRPDLVLTGVDINPEYIRFAKNTDESIWWIETDALLVNIEYSDCVVCTGGIHHLSHNQRSEYMRCLTWYVSYEGFCIIADPCLAPYENNEKERISSVMQLGQHYIEEVKKAGAPDDIIGAASEIMWNDIFGFESKLTFEELHNLVGTRFADISFKRFWPEEDVAYGDYILTARKPKRDGWE